MSEFDFDRWCDLARRDPQAFFRARSFAIEHLIDSHPPSRRESLRAMQRRIDCERARAGTPARALQSIVLMMQDRLFALHEQNEVLLALASKLTELVGVDEVTG